MAMGGTVVEPTHPPGREQQAGDKHGKPKAIKSRLQEGHVLDITRLEIPGWSNAHLRRSGNVGRVSAVGQSGSLSVVVTARTSATTRPRDRATAFPLRVAQYARFQRAHTAAPAGPAE